VNSTNDEMQILFASLAEVLGALCVQAF